MSTIYSLTCSQSIMSIVVGCNQTIIGYPFYLSQLTFCIISIVKGSITGHITVIVIDETAICYLIRVVIRKISTSFSQHVPCSVIYIAFLNRATILGRKRPGCQSSISIIHKVINTCPGRDGRDISIIIVGIIINIALSTSKAILNIFTPTIGIIYNIF
ncbi:hypothetical protein Dtox_0878 [Desulfofarcimen acetoxidans DSM 771]|uniref:Uncharacterized protein n=1 Tax=Desulfofarcimen acetoxidans (strain ATCC 49208 / DSM 771 / KCTC 5769 / VKM B-1644 / 5575) TaxID=485916 RepID=C8W2B1_DESAS|nr:hypothetical protein Dtox_0878 [Desulfofarcimen acetoxidans DSM 771]